MSNRLKRNDVSVGGDASTDVERVELGRLLLDAGRLETGWLVL